jgi:hypothetical protein
VRTRTSARHPSGADATFRVMIGDAAELTEAERAWLVKDEERWRCATDIASRHPGMDVSGVYHVLRNLEKTPSERLRAGLAHGRLFRPDAR